MGAHPISSSPTGLSSCQHTGPKPHPPLHIVSVAVVSGLSLTALAAVAVPDTSCGLAVTTGRSSAVAAAGACHGELVETAAHTFICTASAPTYTEALAVLPPTQPLLKFFSIFSQRLQRPIWYMNALPHHSCCSSGRYVTWTDLANNNGIVH
jgi:hypothetical protein